MSLEDGRPGPRSNLNVWAVLELLRIEAFTIDVDRC